MSTKMPTEDELKLAEQYRLEANRCFQKAKEGRENSEFERAEKLYTESLKLHKNPVTYANRAQLYIELIRPEGAIRDARAALALDSNSLKARFHLGRALFMDSAVGQAITELEKCHLAEPDNALILDALDECKKFLASVLPPSSTATAGDVDGDDVVPQTAFTNLTIIGGWEREPTDKFRVTIWDGEHVMEFDCLRRMQNFLIGLKVCGPIANIQVLEFDVGELYQFFRSLDPKFLDGYQMELLGVRAKNEQKFAEFMALFRPICVQVAPVAVPGHAVFGNFPPCDYSVAMRHIPAIRSAKHLAYRFPQKYNFSPMLSIADLVDWLHSSSAFPPAQEAPSTIKPSSIFTSSADPKEEVR